LRDNVESLQYLRPRALTSPKHILAHPYLAIYQLFIHVLLLIFMIEAILTQSPGRSDSGIFSICKQANINIVTLLLVMLCLTRYVVQEFRSLRFITTHEHATNHTKYSAYSGAPNPINAAAWRHLMQRMYCFLELIPIKLRVCTWNSRINVNTFFSSLFQRL
jgi:hypothetical protein